MNERQHRESPRLLRWPLPLGAIWVLFPLAGVVLGASIQPISPHDYWWHLVMGRYISATGAIPDANLFLYTMEPAARFVDQPWLSQWAMFELREFAGDVGLMWLRNTVVAVTWVVLLGLGLRRASDARALGVVALVAVLLSGKTYGVRTQIFALLPYAALLWLIVELTARRVGWKLGLLLLPLTALWANVHGSFALAPALVGACAAATLGERLLEGKSVAGPAKVWSVALAAALVGGTLTPHGVGVYAYVVELSVVSTVSDTVTEWQSPAWNTFYGMALLVAIAAGSSVLAWRRSDVSLWEVVLFAATAFLASDAIRNFYWFAAVFVLVVAPHAAALSSPKDDAESDENGILNAALALCLLAMPLAAQPASPVFERLVTTLNPDARTIAPGVAVHSSDTPLAIAVMLDQNAYEGRLFHAQHAGGLVEFVLAPAAGEQVAFVDQRMELIPEAVWSAYFSISAAEPGWAEKLDAYRVDGALLSLRTQPRLVEAMQAADGWVEVASDEGHVMFLRAGSESLTRWR